MDTVAAPIPAPIPSLHPPEPHKVVVEKTEEKVDEGILDSPTETDKLVTPAVEEIVETATTTSTLDDLANVNSLLVTRRLKVKGVVLMRGKQNKFRVQTPDKNVVYTIEEENSWWVGYLCYSLRPMLLKVNNILGHEVMKIYRPYAFTTRIFPCQMQRLEVFSPPNQLLGFVHQLAAPVMPFYIIQDHNGDELFFVHGPRITLSCIQNLNFRVMRPDGTQIGVACKRWPGIAHALFKAPVTDSYNLDFDKSLTCGEKALLLAMSILLDYMYFEI